MSLGYLATGFGMAGGSVSRRFYCLRGRSEGLFFRKVPYVIKIKKEEEKNYVHHNEIDYSILPSEPHPYPLFNFQVERVLIS
jgi:hypothetical protein